MTNRTFYSKRDHTLGFCWWNLQDFSHFDAQYHQRSRWPRSTAEFEAKASRLVEAFGLIKRSLTSLDLVMIGEATAVAASQLRDRAFAGFEVFSLDLDATPDFHVAVLYRADLKFQVQGPFAVPFQPRSVRPMAVLDFVHQHHRIRFWVCHWVAQIGKESDHYRTETATAVEREVYRFLRDSPPNENRLAIVVGDLNAEPFGMIEEVMHATRSRVCARFKPHYSDADVERVRLYNCSWRWLGEATPHRERSGKIATAAGTYFYNENRTWHTYDQVLVTGNLVGETRPSLNEANVRVVADRRLIGDDGAPRAFEWHDGKGVGYSDHLPVIGEILL